MKVETIHTDKIDRDSHFSLILESSEFSPFYNVPNLHDVIDSHLNKIVENTDSYIMIVAHDEQTGKLLGQLLVGLDFGRFGLIQAWQPIINPNAERTQVAIMLIEHSKKIINLYNKTKMEIWMELSNDHAKFLSTLYRDWYEKCNFQLTSNEYNMEAKYSELKNLDYTIPEHIEIVPMIEIPIKELHEAVFTAFRSSKASWVNNMSDTEMKSLINSWMKVKDIFHHNSSIVILDNGKIIGFNGMEIQGDSIEIGPIGIIPSHRGKNLGELLVLESIKRLGKDSRERITLSVDTRNIPAIRLYRNLGFKPQFQTLIYSWTE